MTFLRTEHISSRARTFRNNHGTSETGEPEDMLIRVITVIAMLGIATAVAGPAWAAGQAEEIVTKVQLTV